MKDLGTLPGDSFSFGNSINNLGQIVGYSCDANYNCRAFLWQNGSMVDLNTLIPAGSSLFLNYAATIDDLRDHRRVRVDQTTEHRPRLRIHSQVGRVRASSAHRGSSQGCYAG